MQKIRLVVCDGFPNVLAEKNCRAGININIKKHIIFYTSSSKKEINNVKHEIIPYTKITVFSSNNSSKGSLAVRKDP